MDLLQVDTAAASGFSSVRGSLTFDQAKRAFGQGGSRVSRTFTSMRRGCLRSIAEVYVPYHLFEVSISDGERRQSSYFALDAVTGALDVHRFDDRPENIELVHSRNRVPAAIDADDAWPVLVGKLQRALFQTGFFRLRDPRVSGRIEQSNLHMPYWLGFYEAGRRVRVRALDGVRGRFEGGKARTLFESWLTDERAQR
jgi:hypothetical protein